jgi:hypothetical protein
MAKKDVESDVRDDEKRDGSFVEVVGNEEVEKINSVIKSFMVDEVIENLSAIVNELKEQTTLLAEIAFKLDIQQPQPQKNTQPQQKQNNDDLRKIKVKYACKCTGCGKRLQIGWDGWYDIKSKKVYCRNCANA